MIRLGVAFLLLAGGLSAGSRGHAEVGLYLVAAAVLGILWGAGAREMAKYLRGAALFLVVFFVLLIVFNWSPPFRDVRIGAVHFSLPPEALSFGFAAVERGFLAVLIGGSLFLSLGSAGLLAGLCRLRVPDSVTTVLFLMFRYTSVLAEEAQRMGSARRSRELGAWRPRAGILARMSRGFLMRTYGRAESVYVAMCSRGFDGRIPVLVGGRVGWREWIVAGGFVAFVVLVKLYFHGRTSGLPLGG